jgi:hypothetical protein
MFEPFQRPLLPRHVFLARLGKSVLFGLGLVAVSLFAGMVGFHSFEPPMSWLDSFLNASMLLSGMGPLGTPKTDPGKLFAGFYALYSGFAVLGIAGVTFAPVVHRVLHRFHLEESGAEEQDD